MASNVNRKGFCIRCGYVHKREQHNPAVIKKAQEAKL